MDLDGYERAESVHSTVREAMSSQMIGFVGVGRMGGPMASRLLDSGHSLCVFDTSAAAMKPLVDRGAKAAASAGEVASSA